MPPRRVHWLNEIASDAIARARAMGPDVGATIKDVVPFGNPPPKPQPPTLDAFMQAPPDARQAFLSGLGDNYGKVVSQLMNEANSRYGAMAQKLMPMFQMDAMQSQLPNIQSDDPSLGVAAAAADLQELLGVQLNQPGSPSTEPAFQ